MTPAGYTSSNVPLKVKRSAVKVKVVFTGRTNVWVGGSPSIGSLSTGGDDMMMKTGGKPGQPGGKPGADGVVITTSDELLTMIGLLA